MRGAAEMFSYFQRKTCLSDGGLTDPPSFNSLGLQLHSLYLSVLHSCPPLEISQLSS